MKLHECMKENSDKIFHALILTLYREQSCDVIAELFIDALQRLHNDVSYRYILKWLLCKDLRITNIGGNR